MKLLTKELREKLLANGRANRRADGLPLEETIDHKPVVKFFVPWGAGTWLLTELDPNDPDIAFGLCDLGQGYPELGNVAISEIESIRGPGGLRIERDLHFEADKTLKQYADEARSKGRIEA